ncbi:hypothetical protein SLS60_006677 [Paraconiothyrium brasiliense]|uniref:Uncharacterized protein n=1 Tax=Paraconiothyrium brasiliense TaxID=300254 RepID=A0ABR3RBL6_9PLEO
MATNNGDEDDGKGLHMSAKQEKFMLQNYSKAIRYLQPHLTTKIMASTRIALIACAIFTCLEFLRGNFKTAQTHLKNGLLVLQETYGDTHDGVVIMRTMDHTDRWITETFQRLHIQVELFYLTHNHSSIILQQNSSTSPPPQNTFPYLREAWSELNRIFYNIIALRNKAHLHHIPAGGSQNHGTCDSELIPLQQLLQASLHQWHTTYTSSKPHLDSEEPTLVINAMIMSFYTLAAILCSTSLSSELAYDAHTTRFLAIITYSAHLRTSRPPPKICDRAGFNMAHSIVDFGWIPPLYYTAIKCRVRRVRLYALLLLESTMHREGIWDCRIMSRIMRKVMEIEDGSLYGDDGEGYASETLPELDGLGSPEVPLEKRLREIRVEMDDEMTENVMMEYKKACYPAGWERVRVCLTAPYTGGIQLPGTIS